MLCTIGYVMFHACLKLLELIRVNRGKNARFSSFCQISQKHLEKLGNECVILCNTCLLYYVQIQFCGHYADKGKFSPLQRRNFGGRFYPGPGVKTPTLLVTDIITMATSKAFVVTFICFVFHKAWLSYSIASETFLFPL